jgi:hypothetical protein
LGSIRNHGFYDDMHGDFKGTDEGKGDGKGDGGRWKAEDHIGELEGRNVWVKIMKAFVKGSEGCDEWDRPLSWEEGEVDDDHEEE